MQVAKGPVVDQTAEFAELRRQIDLVDPDVTLVNKRFDEPQSMRSYFLICLGNCKMVLILI